MMAIICVVLFGNYFGASGERAECDPQKPIGNLVTDSINSFRTAAGRSKGRGVIWLIVRTRIA